MAGRSKLSTNDVPYLADKQIEREADLLLAEYCEEFEPISKPPVPIDEIADAHLQLKLEFRDLTPLFAFADVHGAIWFSEKRIGITPQLDPTTNPNRRGRYHFTLAHEVGHWRLHRSHYLGRRAERRLFADGMPEPDVVCRSSEKKKRVEWQANAFAACLLMPRKLIYAAWADFRGNDDPVLLGDLRDQFPHLVLAGKLSIGGTCAMSEEEIDNSVKEEFCRPFADTFQVSPEAMRYRLEDLKLIVKEKPAMLF